MGVAHLEKALERLGTKGEAELVMRAFELDSDAPAACASDTVERLGAKYGLTHEEAAARVEEISQLGREAGIDFRYAATRSTNTFDAHRLAKLAQEKHPALAETLELHLYDAYFTQNVELADHEVLREVALRAGLRAEDVDRVLACDECADEVRLDEREAAMRGIHGVPFFVVAGKVAIPGCASVEQLDKLLFDLLRQEREAASAGESVVGVCGPDGCRF